METNKKLEVHKNETESRFEAVVGDDLAIAEYRQKGNTITFTHTEVPEELEGQGVASTLIKSALETARSEKLEVVPLCPFVAAYIKRHQEYLDLVKPEYRDRYRV